MNFREEVSTGYMYCYASSHMSSNKNGKLLEHVYIMSENLGRTISKDESIHHIDRNRKNNVLSNLQLMPKSAHLRLHSLEVFGKRPNLLGYRNGEIYDTVTGEILENIKSRCCLYCGDTFTPDHDWGVYCSNTCRGNHTRIFNPSKEELQAKIWSVPTTHIAKEYNVSDVAVSKRCKLLGIAKPPRGYWAKESAKKNSSCQH